MRERERKDETTNISFQSYDNDCKAWFTYMPATMPVGALKRKLCEHLFADCLQCHSYTGGRPGKLIELNFAGISAASRGIMIHAVAGIYVNHAGFKEKIQNINEVYQRRNISREENL